MDNERILRHTGNTAMGKFQLAPGNSQGAAGLWWGRCIPTADGTSVALQPQPLPLYGKPERSPAGKFISLCLALKDRCLPRKAAASLGIKNVTAFLPNY